MMIEKIKGFLLLFILSFFSFGPFLGCSSTYYNVWEALGKEKRDLLKDNIEEVQEGQKESKEEVLDAYQKLKTLYNFQGGELEKAYDQLKNEYEEAQAESEGLKGRIQQVQDVAEDLFKEWKKEAKSMENKDLQRASLRNLDLTERNYEQMLKAMKQAEKSLNPILSKLRDHVLFLKHQLNAKALGVMREEVQDIEKDIQNLIAEVEQSIGKSEEFIKTMPQ